MAFFFSKLFRNLVILAVLLNGINWYLRIKSYTILAKDFKTISTSAADDNSLNAISKFGSDFRRKYSRITAPTAEWVPLSAGGLHLKVQFLYGDLTEYVAIFSSTGLTSGRTGLHWSNSTCTVLSGEITRVPDAFSSPVKETLIKGQNFRHGQFDSYIYYFADDTTIACYGRGFMPASSYWALSGSLANGDPIAAGKFIYVYGRLLLDGIARNFQDATNYVKNKATKLEL